MATGTGLDAQIGFVPEVSYGTPVTVTRFPEFTSESLAFQPTFLEPAGLRPGREFKRGSRVVRSRVTGSGEIAIPHTTKGMGLFWAHALGSSGTATQIAATTAYEQVHHPGALLGKSLTCQVGRPEPGGTVRAHTFTGCKISGWSFGISDNDIPTLGLTVDARNEQTDVALATAAYIAGANNFSFNQATVFKLGGTASTASGKISVTGGVQVATVVRSISFSGSNPLQVERYGIGNAGLKSQPLSNDHRTITGSMEAEFSKTELYDVFKDDEFVPLELAFIGPEIEPGHNFELRFIAPQVKFKTSTPAVGGPDIVPMATEIEIYDDEVNPPFQVYIKSTDTAI